MIKIFLVFSAICFLPLYTSQAEEKITKDDDPIIKDKYLLAEEPPPVMVSFSISNSIKYNDVVVASERLLGKLEYKKVKGDEKENAILFGLITKKSLPALVLIKVEKDCVKILASGAIDTEFPYTGHSNRFTFDFATALGMKLLNISKPVPQNSVKDKDAKKKSKRVAQLKSEE